MGWRTVARTTAVAALLVAGATAEARADTIALTFDDTVGIATTFGTNSTAGWSFVLSQPVTVTRLGYWDLFGDGLTIAHDVGIFTAGGALVVSGNVPSGGAAPLESGFRFTSSLTGTTTLAAGSYVIGAFVGAFTDQPKHVVPSGSVTTIPELTYGTSFFASGASLTFPNVAGGIPSGFFGPTFAVAVTPEPGTTALFGLGALGLAGVVVRRRRAARRAPASA